MRIVPTLSREKQDKLDRYVALLDRWRRVTNLVSEQSFARVWERHIEDALYLQLNCPAKRLWLDIGSGAGLPGIVLGIALCDAAGARIHCVESDGRKCAFLRSVAQDLGLPVKVRQARMEFLHWENVGDIEVVTARALASVPRILAMAQPYLDRGAMLVLPRGQTGQAEIEVIDRVRYCVTSTANPDPSGGVILSIKNRN